MVLQYCAKYVSQEKGLLAIETVFFNLKNHAYIKMA
jgi:hypothetical protein